MADAADDISRTRRHDYYALVLTTPVCVGAPGEAHERGVGIVELRAPATRLKGLLGRDVAATGALAHAGREAEPTAVYMRVRRLQPWAAAK